MAKLEDKLITSETDNTQLRTLLQWYMMQVERVEDLHSSFLRNVRFHCLFNFRRHFEIHKTSCLNFHVITFYSILDQNVAPQIKIPYRHHLMQVPVTLQTVTYKMT